jgi:hypothetical protein
MTKYALIRTDLDGSTTEITTGTKAEMTERYDACYQTNLNGDYADTPEGTRISMSKLLAKGVVHVEEMGFIVVHNSTLLARVFCTVVRDLQECMKNTQTLREQFGAAVKDQGAYAVQNHFEKVIQAEVMEDAIRSYVNGSLFVPQADEYEKTGVAWDTLPRDAAHLLTSLNLIMEEMTARLMVAQGALGHYTSPIVNLTNQYALKGAAACHAKVGILHSILKRRA